MLTPKQLEGLPESLIRLYSQVEIDILKDMARRIATYDYFIPSAEWQFLKTKELGNLNSQIIKYLANYSGKSQTEIKQLMQAAGAEALLTDDKIYRKAGLSPPPIKQDKALQAVLKAGYLKTNKTFKNITKTTAKTATKQFENALDRAYMQITSGAFDSNTAIRNAIKSLSKDGVGAIRYPSGKIDNLEVAVRRATLTGVNQTALKLQDMRADEMGCDLVETSAHGGARPEHAAWQGKIFSRSGKHSKYPPFAQSTGYGTGAGLGGWNCRHSFFPFFEGISKPAYTKADLAGYEAKNYEYNGIKMTEYEATQKQRHIERQQRRWKRENMAMSAAGKDTSESAAKIAKWQATEKDFIKQTGLKPQSDRSMVGGFGKSEAQKAAWAAKLPDKVIRFNKTHKTMSEKELLPAYAKAKISEEKILGYALNLEHIKGHDKAVAFEKYLGYTKDNASELISNLYKGLAVYKSKARKETVYGKPFEVIMMIKGPNGKYARVKSGWIIDNDSDFPRLTSVYIDE